jgi:hypothetical protein
MMMVVDDGDGYLVLLERELSGGVGGTTSI